mmetsp:Transcript_62668/g.167965  ORF Transcript_62668/g.167965 Transcript_62668/m.167965 type:complete len:208 (+) Transcript_62668:826-1449(+)
MGVVGGHLRHDGAAHPTGHARRDGGAASVACVRRPLDHLLRHPLLHPHLAGPRRRLPLRRRVGRLLAPPLAAHVQLRHDPLRGHQPPHLPQGAHGPYLHHRLQRLGRLQRAIAHHPLLPVGLGHAHGARRDGLPHPRLQRPRHAGHQRGRPRHLGHLHVLPLLPHAPASQALRLRLLLLRANRRRRGRRPARRALEEPTPPSRLCSS